ncbi:MAG: hypothetical protein JRG91_09440 [Deltaproteobacteria bacterium]|nr:hypothetical protein [Deltaproteobacteria bacterium]
MTAARCLWCAAALAAALLFAPRWADARSLEIGRSYSVGAFGGLQNLDRWDVGVQALTLHGPGDSSLIMFNVGLGLDVSYARLGEAHQLRLVPVFELLFFIVFIQVGTGAAIDLEHPGLSGADLMLVTGLKLFLGDEYQAPALAVGVRMDGIIGRRSAFVPSAYVALSFTIDP